MSICVCLICLNPNETWFDFLCKFINYEVLVVIDNNTIDYKGCFKNYTKINVVQIKDDECEENGFIDMNFTMGKKITGWEKALYYFSTLTNKYKKVWFLEDDVFIYDETTLSNIDSKYSESDLLTSTCRNNNKNDPWHWDKFEIKLPLPYYHAMVCAVRISDELMSKIKNYAKENKTLFFLEALFPTICKHYGLKYDVPKELTTVTWRKVHDLDGINKTNVYHPMKNIKNHIMLRKK